MCSYALVGCLRLTTASPPLSKSIHYVFWLVRTKIYFAYKQYEHIDIIQKCQFCPSVNASG